MTASLLIARCRDSGIVLTANGDRLTFKAPKGLPRDLRAALTEHKLEVLDLLNIVQEVPLVESDPPKSNNNVLELASPQPHVEPAEPLPVIPPPAVPKPRVWTPQARLIDDARRLGITLLIRDGRVVADPATSKPVTAHDWTGLTIGLAHFNPEVVALLAERDKGP